jgi:hypothetical protein
MQRNELKTPKSSKLIQKNTAGKLNSKDEVGNIIHMLDEPESEPASPLEWPPKCGKPTSQKPQIANKLCISNVSSYNLLNHNHSPGKRLKTCGVKMIPQDSPYSPKAVKTEKAGVKKVAY